MKIEIIDLCDLGHQDRDKIRVSHPFRTRRFRDGFPDFLFQLSIRSRTLMARFHLR
ncbi:hypothetical protein B0G57_14116 [Trinickia symbiotica]|nr:hypothetical protein B0G57_14116 [Trinickia symbiotica]